MAAKNSSKSTTDTVYAELSKALNGIAPNEGETETEFLTRLTEAVSGLSDEDYNKLSPAAQKWFNTSGEAINANAPDKIPSLPGLPKIEAKADSGGGDDAGEAQTTSTTEKGKGKEMKGKKAVAKAPEKTATPAKKTTAKAAPAKASRGRTATNGDAEAIKLIVKDNPKRPGSASFKRFALYAKSKTVGAFLKAGGSRADLRYDTEHKYITVG